MDDQHNDDQRARASLRGKGREILLGQRQGMDDILPETPPPQRLAAQGAVPDASAQPDPSALALTPEETNALLNFADDSPVYRPDYEFARPEEPSAWVAEPVPSELKEPGVPEIANTTPGNTDDGMLDSGQWTSAEADEASEPDPFMTAQAVPTEMLLNMEDTPSDVAAEPGSLTEAVPIAERAVEVADQFFQAPYELSEEVEALTPRTPEHWSDDMLTCGQQDEVPPVFKHSAYGTAYDKAARDDGGVYVSPPETAASESAASTPIGDPFPPLKRTQSEDLFKATPLPDREMLDKLVSDEQIQKLWTQMEVLHEDLAKLVEGERSETDDFQRELLRASGLLLESRHNYDDARAIVYRIQADLNWRRRVYADIKRYRPLLLAYYMGWGLVLVVLFLLKKPVAELAEDMGLEVLSALYYPLLMGIVGAMISGYLTLDRHTTKQRDFDPMHVTWYLFNPLLGGVMGLLMFLLASIANEDLLQNAASRGEMAITYLLCVIAGMNQTNVLRRMNELMDRFTSGVKK